MKEIVIYTVILNWENYADTKKCIESFQRIKYNKVKIIVVDNGSLDGSGLRLQEEFPDTIFCFNKQNLGFARGCNVGIKVALADPQCHYVLLLNNDMRVDGGFLEPAIRAAEADPRVGLVTGKVLYDDPPNLIWHAGGYIHPIRRQGMTRGFREIDRGQYDQICETHWASGAMMLIKRRVLETVGLLPEEYFFGQEEWDYSVAVRRAAFKILYVPEFKAFHKAGGSYPAGHPVLIVYNSVRNKLIFNQKYLPKPMWHLWRLLYWVYLQVLWPRRARWGCRTEQDYQVRLQAARLAFKDHRGIRPIELADLKDAARRLGPTPTWGAGWHPKAGV
jgi:GT2 family glycosyltransferase